MTEKRFTDDGIEEIENQSFTDNLTGKTYWIDHGLDEIVDLLNKFANENEQLKQRNTNQYNQLTELWEIIEEENWEKLIAMKKQLKEDEERLQKEWVCYE